MILSPLPYRDAKDFIEHYHYSQRMPKGKNICFGWFDMDLYAVACYGNGVNTYQASSLASLTGYPITNDNLVELKRLARTEPRRDDAPLTQFLSQCHKALKREGIRFIVSFSDPEQGHSGGIYKAANFRHWGQTAAERHVQDATGQVRHRRYVYRYAKRHGVSQAAARQQLGVTVYTTTPKDRWLLAL